MRKLPALMLALLVCALPPVSSWADAQSSEAATQYSAPPAGPSFPIEAGSWGGKLRAGPGMQYGHIASLPEGEPVALLSQTGEWMNGYPWFHIRLADGLEGFQWGGILCARSHPVEGLHKTCRIEAPPSQVKSLKNNQITYLELPLKDVAATKRFYGGVFGWEFQDWGPDYLGFTGAGMDGGFNREISAPPSGSGTLVILYTDHLEQMVLNVEAAGGTVTKAPFSFPGGKRFHFLDPNGTELAIWSDKP